MKTNFWKPLFILFAGLYSGQAWSQNAGNWNFNNTLNGTAAANITSSPAALSSTTVGSFNSGSEYYGEGGWPAAAIDTSVYLQFKLSAGGGYYLSLNSVTITFRRSTTGTAAGSGPMQWSLRSSLDNFATDLSAGSLTTSYATTVITLPAAFQTVASTVTFHLYGYNMVVTTGGNNRFVWDNVSVQGQATAGTLAERNISFQAKANQQNGSVQLQWKTTGFPAGTSLTVERSSDGSDFSTIGQQQTITDDGADYQYEDIPVTSSRLYYRIIASEPDGQIYRSPIAIVEEKAAKSILITGIIGQGTGGAVKALLNLPENGQYQMFLTTLDGKTLSRRLISGSMGKLTMDIDLGNYPHGAYILTLVKGARVTSREFIN